MKKKGFTLIELLAVIIILAIVALIATPVVLNIIEDTRKSAFEQSALGYYNATKYIYNEMFLDGELQDINFTFKDGVQTSSNSNYKLEVSGEKPKGGLIYLFKDGRITLSIHNNKYCANVDHEGKVSITEDINDCTSGITEIPSECFSITSETVSNVSYNMLDYDRTNSNCPLNIDTLIIPSEINGQPVEGIGSYAFHHTRGKVSTNTQAVSVKNVIMPDGIKVINTYAFYQAGLINAVIPEGVTMIRSCAFRYNQLSSVTLPSSLKTISNSSVNNASRSYAFANNQITEITIPENVELFGASIFSSNPLTKVTFLAKNMKTSMIGSMPKGVRIAFPATVKEVIIGNQVTRIPAYFFNNLNLTNITIPNSVTSIGSYAFINNQLTSIDIPSSVTSIGTAAFNNNQLLDSQAFIYARNIDGTIDTTNLVSYGGAKKDNVVIPDGVTNIENYAFFYNKLTSVTIPNSVTSIGTHAFYDSPLTSITIPSSVTSIGSYAFTNNNFPNAQAITIEGDATRFDSNWTSIGFPVK